MHARTVAHALLGAILMSCAARSAEFLSDAEYECRSAPTTEYLADLCLTEVTGIVFLDRVTWRRPFRGAYVCLGREAAEGCDLAAKTGEDGLFRFPVRSGRYKLTACSLGFVRIVAKVTVSPECHQDFLELTTRPDT
jgi:hypothetical protein